MTNKRKLYESIFKDLESTIKTKQTMLFSSIFAKLLRANINDEIFTYAVVRMMLHAVVKHRNTDIFEKILLLSCGDNIDKRNVFLRSALEDAFDLQSYEMIVHIMIQFSNNGLNSFEEIYRGRIYTDYNTLDKDSNKDTSSFEKLIVSVCVNGNLGLAEFLVKLKGNIDLHKMTYILTIALCHKKFEIFKYLINNGANINSLCSCDAYSLMHEAVREEQIDFVKFLMEKGARRDIGLDAKESPIITAIKCTNIEMVEILIQYGFNINQIVTDASIEDDFVKFGDSPLMTAIRHLEYYNRKYLKNHIDKHLSLLKFLILNGADVNLKNTDTNETPLKIAIDNGIASIVKLLVEYKADLKTPVSDDSLPLDYAIQKYNEDKSIAAKEVRDYLIIRVNFDNQISKFNMVKYIRVTSEDVLNEIDGVLTKEYARAGSKLVAMALLYRRLPREIIYDILHYAYQCYSPSPQQLNQLCDSLKSVDSKRKRNSFTPHCTSKQTAGLKRKLDNFEGYASENEARCLKRVRNNFRKDNP